MELPINMVTKRPAAALGGAALASMIFLAIAATSIAFSQAAPWALAGLAVAGLVECGPQAVRDRLRQTPWPYATVLALALLAALSAIWAPKAGVAIVKGIALAGVSMAVALGAGLLASPQPDRRSTLASGLGIGLGLGLLFVAINALTDDYLTRWVLWHLPGHGGKLVGKHVRLGADFVQSVSESVSNRPMAVATLLAIPGWLVVRNHASPALSRIYLACFAAFAIAVLIGGTHQSSQLALACGVSAYLLARANRGLAIRLLAVAWCVAILAMPLVAAALARADVHNASWLFTSARARVIIWGLTAQKIAERPLLGHGVVATETIQKNNPKPEWRPGDYYPQSTARHAHNAYLQIWFELGAAGALLFCAFGLAVLDRVRWIARDDQPEVIAALALVATMIATSYGLWQLWIQSAIAIAAILLIVAQGRRTLAPNLGAER